MFSLLPDDCERTEKTDADNNDLSIGFDVKLESLVAGTRLTKNGTHALPTRFRDILMIITAIIVLHGVIR